MDVSLWEQCRMNRAQSWIAIPCACAVYAEINAPLTFRFDSKLTRYVTSDHLLHDILHFLYIL